jgi:cytochrome c-type biogenesis protein CcmH
MLAGTVAFDREEYARAAQYWEQARTVLPAEAEPEVMQELTAGIAEARSLLGVGSQTVPTSTGEAVPPPNRNTLAISGKVSLAPPLVDKGSPTDTLFVFARAVDGPPMPVAIVQATQRDLPFTFRLDDSNSPMPARKLSQAETVVIVARISKSGQAMPKSGDLEGRSQPVKPGAKGVTVVIDQELP